MVGVPGKSKGCHTCRRRKVRCDEAKPICQRCMKSGRECEGYEKGPVFLNRTARGLEKRRHLDEVLLKDGSEASASSGSASAATNQSSTSPKPTVSDGSDLISARLPRRSSDMNLTAEEIQRTLSQQYLPAANPCGASFGAWFLHTFELDPWGELLETSLMALAMSRKGKVRGDESMTLQGRLKYGKALHLLQQALADDQKSFEDQTLAACNTLKYYEVCEATEDSVHSFDSHVHGIVRLLLHRGWGRNDTTFGRALVNDVRYAAMLTAIQNRQRSVIGGTEWRKHSWETATDVEQALFDLGFDIAGVAEDADFGDLSSTSRTIATRTCLSRALELVQRLKDWHAAASIFMGWTHWWTEPLSRMLQAPPHPGPSPQNSPMAARKVRAEPDMPSQNTNIALLQQSLMITDYLALMLCISVIIRTLASRLSSSSPNAALLLTECASYDQDFQIRLASNVLVLFPFQTHSWHGLQASGRMIFSLRCASHPAKVYDTAKARELGERVGQAIKYLADNQGLNHARVVLEAGKAWGDPT